LTTRIGLLNQIDSSRPNPFLFCNVLFKGIGRLAARYPSRVTAELINMALAEYLKGTLEYEPSQVDPDSWAEAIGVMSMPKKKKEERLLPVAPLV
jgi:hypothetical protein